MTATELSIAELIKLDILPYNAKLVLDLYIYKTTHEFVELVNSAIEQVIEILSRNPQHQQDLSENQITNQFVNQLIGMGLDASFDTATGGHCDITVKSRHGEIWLGEAKLDKRGIPWVWEGFLQLDSRYMPGGAKSNSGGIIIYCYRSNIHKFMAEWKQHLQDQIAGITVTDCLELPPLNRTPRSC